MCRLPGRFCVLAGALLALNGAGVVWIRARVVSTPNPRLRVLRALPERGVDDADRFSLIFDEKLAGKDELAKPLPESPFVVRPEPDGHWEWTKPDRLDFILGKRLPAGRVYRVLPAPSFELQTGRSLVGKSAFTFRTRPLRVVSSRLQSFDNSNATFEIVFNQKVHPADVVKYIRVSRRSAGPPRRPVALVKEPAESVVLRVERRGSEHLRVVLDGRLAGHGGELPLGKPYVRTLYIAPAFALLGANAYTPSLGTYVRVNVRVSSRLDRSQRLPDVEVTPHVENVRVSRRYRSLVLEGPFESGTSYTARVIGNLLSHDGQVLGPRETVTFTVPDRQPALRFKHGRGILMPEGNLALEVEMVNVPGVHVSASRVHAENIVAHVRGAHTSATSRRLVGRTFVLDLPRNKPGVVEVNLARLLEHTERARSFSECPLGVYQLEARSTSCRWRRHSSVVTVTDLGITAKRGRGGFLVWVSSLKTGRPVQGVRVSAFTYNNKRLAESATGPDGAATLEVPPKHPDGPAWLIVAQRTGAERGEDMNFLLPGTRRWVIDRVDQGGRAAPETYDVMLYTERGVYRPGDVVHVTGVVRDADGGVPPAFPVAIKVTRPDGRPAAELTALPEAAQGIFHAELRTREGFQTGRYRFDAALPGSEEVLGSTHAMVEAFVPVRIEVTAATTKERYLPEDDPELECEARYLFGRPAAELALSVEGEYRRVEFRSKRHPGFSFRPAALGKRVKLPARKLKLDGDGTAKVALASTRPKEPGLWRALLSATVTETGGRSVSANASALVDSAGRHVGLRMAGDRFVRAGRPVRFEWAAVTGDDEPVTAGEVELSLHRVDYDYIWQEVNGRRVWKHTECLHQVFKRVSDAKEAARGVGGTEFACPLPGRYRLRALDRRSGGVAQLEFYASDPAYGSARAATDRPERVEIVLDRKSYAPGSKAKALVRSPFPGTMLFTVETDRVIARRVVELHGGSAEVVFDVDPALRGGAFLTATVVRPIDPREKSWKPHRAMGLARLVTDHSARKLAISIDAPRKARPGESLAVTVSAGLRRKATAGSVALAKEVAVRRGTPSESPFRLMTGRTVGRPAYVHVWAVDEGVLLATAFGTPDPHGHFFARRRAGVATSDVYNDLLPDFERPESIDRIGAGAGGKRGDFSKGMARRRNPVATRRRAPAVVWRAASPLGPDGRAVFQLDMPDMTGEMRIMAVVVDGDRYASSERAVTLTAPLLVEASWPRFASPGDAFSVPVKLFNTTDAPLSVSLGIAIAGPVAVERGPKAHGILVNPRRPALAWLDARALNLGPVTARVAAKASSRSGEELAAKASSDFPVRPVAPLHAEARSFLLKAGQKLRIDPAGGFFPGSARTTLSVGPDALVEVRPAVQRLIGYPYGCIEQTSSRLYAMLYAPDLLLLDPAPGRSAPAAHADDSYRRSRSRRIAEMVEAGIDRLWSMQTPCGGLGYWPGATKPHLWGTGYASFFLLKAKQDGYDVDERFTKSLTKYLAGVLRDRRSGALDDNTRALFCHVLAGFGRPEHGWMARLSELSDKLDMAGRANLAAAWFSSGRKDRAKAVLSEDTLEMPVVSSTGGRITSKLRQEAVLLLVLLDVAPESASIPTLARRINAARKKRGYWGSTLENATALAALSRYQTLVGAEAKYTGRATLPGGGELAFDSASPAVREFKDTGEPIEVASAGRGTLYISVTTEGLAVGRSVPEYDRRLKVRRRWTDSGGRAIDPAKLNVGDLVRVETTLSAPGLGRRGTVHNVAIVDALPGGMEVENPRLATSAHAGNGGARGADHVEFLDDRVVIFTSIGRHARTFRYCVRAITEGDFALPPVQASCMYDAAYASVNGAGRIRVGRHESDRGDASQAAPDGAKPKPASPGERPPPAGPRPAPAPDPAPAEVDEPPVLLPLAAVVEQEAVE